MSTLSSVQSEDRIRAIAYGLWLAEGRPDGRADAHWLKAHDLASSESQPAAIKPNRASAIRKAATRKRA